MVEIEKERWVRERRGILNDTDDQERRWEREQSASGFGAGRGVNDLSKTRADRTANLPLSLTPIITYQIYFPLTMKNASKSPTGQEIWKLCTSFCAVSVIVKSDELDAINVRGASFGHWTKRTTDHDIRVHHNDVYYYRVLWSEFVMHAWVNSQPGDINTQTQLVWIPNPLFPSAHSTMQTSPPLPPWRL